MTKYQVTVYVSGEALAAIRGAAEKASRSVSQWAGMVLEREANGEARYQASITATAEALEKMAEGPIPMQRDDPEPFIPAGTIIRNGPMASPEAPGATNAPPSTQDRWRKPSKPTGSPCFSCGCRGGVQEVTSCRLYGCACHKTVS